MIRPRHGLLAFASWLLLGCVFDASGIKGAPDRGAKDGPRPEGRLAEASVAFDEGAQDVLVRDASKPDVPRDLLAPDTSCGSVATVGCWDIWGVFSTTNFERISAQLQIFGKAIKDGQKVYAFLNGATDNTYTESQLHCSSGTFMRPEAWDIERKPVDSRHYTLLVRGRSDNACVRPRVPAACAGEVHVNAARGWHIASNVNCHIDRDYGEQPGGKSHCTVDFTTNTISWRSGAVCQDCCMCGEPASVDIEVQLVKR